MGSSCNSLANIRAVIGMIVYCSSSPLNISLGMDRARLKSSRFNVNPILNMITVSNGIMAGFNSVKGAGIKKAMLAKAIAQSGNNRVNNSTLYWVLNIKMNFVVVDRDRQSL